MEGPATGDVFVLSIGSLPHAPLFRIEESLRGEPIYHITGSHARTLILVAEGTIGAAEAGEPLKALDGQLGEVSFGESHSVVLTRSGQVYTLGQGAYGQLGHGGTSSCAEPKLLAHLMSRMVVQASEPPSPNTHATPAHCVTLSHNPDHP